MQQKLVTRKQNVEEKVIESATTKISIHLKIVPKRKIATDTLIIQHDPFRKRFTNDLKH